MTDSTGPVSFVAVARVGLRVVSEFLCARAVLSLWSGVGVGVVAVVECREFGCIAGLGLGL